MNGQFSGLYPGDRKYFKARKLSLNCYKLYKMTKDWLFKRSTIEHAEKIRLNLSCFGSGPVFGRVGWNFTGRCHGGRFEMFFLHICILTGLWHQRVSTQGHIPLICTTWVKKNWCQTETGISFTQVKYFDQHCKVALWHLCCYQSWKGQCGQEVLVSVFRSTTPTQWKGGAVSCIRFKISIDPDHRFGPSLVLNSPLRQFWVWPHWKLYHARY